MRPIVASTSSLKNLRKNLFHAYSRNYSGSFLQIEAFGEPRIAVKRATFENVPSFSTSPKSMVLQLYGAPVNQADINFIQGVYPIGGKVAFPKVVGFEGAFKVVEVGDQVSNFKVDDLVLIPFKFCGTWTDYLSVDQSHCIKIPNNLDPITAATMRVNPSTAYRMLSDFVKLEPGDMVAVNGASSHVGECVVQMCKALNLKTICLIRSSVYQQNVINRLKMLGATHVVPEDDMKKKSASCFLAQDEIGAKLGINMIGGSSFKLLDDFVIGGSPIVTIGGLSKSAIRIKTSSLVFGNKSLVGFKLGSWMMKNRTNGQFQQMMDQICQLYLNGHLQKPAHCIPTKLVDFETAFEDKVDENRPSQKTVFIH